jgi:hypothetical protein
MWEEVRFLRDRALWMKCVGLRGWRRMEIARAMGRKIEEER